MVALFNLLLQLKVTIVVFDAVYVVFYVGEEPGKNLPVPDAFGDLNSASPVFQLLVQSTAIGSRNTLQHYFKRRQIVHVPSERRSMRTPPLSGAPLLC